MATRDTLAGATPDSPEVVRELAAGGGMSFREAAKLLPGKGGRTASPSTLWRWAGEGVRLPGGRVVRLEVARLGCRWFTTRGAVLRFVAAQNEPAPEQAPPPPPAPKVRQGRRTRHDEAVESLREAGWM